MSDGQRRIGVFGGAFDPPHIAHQALADAALAQLALDELRVIPTGSAWHKARGLSASAHRLAMAERAFADRARVIVDPREIRRTGPSYTVDTLRELHALLPDSRFFLVIGQDQAARISRWHAWQEVLRLATLCVAARPAVPDDALATAAADPLPAGSRLLALPPLAVSATDIRQRVARGEAVDALVGPAVARYIADHHLYQAP